MGWFGDHDWQTWLVAAFVLAGFEMATLDFTLLMMAVGALAGCLAALLGFGVAIQVVTAAVVAVGLIAFVRPSILSRVHRGASLESGTSALVGKSALVLERVTAHNGRVKLSGEIWSARAADDSQTIEPGTTVSVSAIDGATAVVQPLPAD
jgi:membrane protein implicated in regulation of membrane protease activity